MDERKLIDLREGRIPKEYVAVAKNGLVVVTNLKFERRHMKAIGDHWSNFDIKRYGPYDLAENSLEGLSEIAPKNAVAFRLSSRKEILAYNEDSSRHNIHSIFAVQFYRYRRKGE